MHVSLLKSLLLDIVCLCTQIFFSIVTTLIHNCISQDINLYAALKGFY